MAWSLLLHLSWFDKSHLTIVHMLCCCRHCTVLLDPSLPSIGKTSPIVILDDRFAFSSSFYHHDRRFYRNREDAGKSKRVQQKRDHLFGNSSACCSTISECACLCAG